MPKYAHLATYEEIKENEYNLNIPRYVDTFEAEAPIDMAAIGAEMKALRKEKEMLTQNLMEMMGQLQYGEENAAWMKGAMEVLSDGK